MARTEHHVFRQLSAADPFVGRMDSYFSGTVAYQGSVEQLGHLGPSNC